MTRYLQLEQGSQSWHAWRTTKLGGSSIAAALGVYPFKTAKDEWEEQVGLAPKQQPNYAMWRGSHYEQEARELYIQRTDNYVWPTCVEHDSISWLGASLDGLDVTGELLLEVKVPNIEAHRLALSGKVPDYYRPQLQHQLLTSGATVAHYWSYSKKKDVDYRDVVALVEVGHDPELQEKILTYGERFWRAVLAGREEVRQKRTPSWSDMVASFNLLTEK